MKFFKKVFKEVDELDKTIQACKETSTPKPEPEPSVSVPLGVCIVTPSVVNLMFPDVSVR